MYRLRWINVVNDSEHFLDGETKVAQMAGLDT